jgi:hypothetical protein
MSSVIRLERRRPRIREVEMLPEMESEEDSRRHLWIYMATFSAIALTMYTVAVITAFDSLEDTLWLVWLIFVIALSKLILANGICLMLMRSESNARTEEQRLAPSSIKRRTTERPKVRLRLVTKDPGCSKPRD